MKKPRPAALPSVTFQMSTHCGKIYVTVTIDDRGLPFETFVRFGKAGHCGAAIFDATTKLLSYALRSGMDPHEAVKALGGIGCHCGTDSCMNAVSMVLKEVLEHSEGGYTPFSPQPVSRGEVSPSRKPPGTNPLAFSTTPSAGRSPQRPRDTTNGPKPPERAPFWPLYRPQPVSVIPPSLPPALQFRRSPENRLTFKSASPSGTPSNDGKNE